VTSASPCPGPKADVIVIGAGLHGCSAALQLARRRRRVLVIEQSTSGRHASGVNAGGLRRLGRHPAEIPLAVAAMEMWHRIEDLVDSDCGFRATGQIKIAENDDDMHILEERAALVRSLGYDHEEIIGSSELRDLVPEVVPGCVGGLVSRRDGFASPFHATRAFRDKAASLGAEFIERNRVTGIERRQDLWHVLTGSGTFTAPIVLNCAGAWGDQIAAMLGDVVPLKAEAPMMMVTARIPHFLEPVVALTSRKLSFKQMANGTVIIGGGYRGFEDRESETAGLDFSRLKINAQTVVDVFPHMRDVPIVRIWAGLEGMTPDDIPVIGVGAASPDAFHAFGFSAHGFQLGPIVGRILSELIVDGTTSMPIEAFSVTRFAQPSDAS
jgi:sarcosine oxidase subunit beta